METAVSSLVQKNILPNLSVAKDKMKSSEVTEDLATTKYHTALTEIWDKGHKNDKPYFEKLLQLRKEMSDSKLIEAQKTTDSNLRAEGYRWEATQWYTEIALDVIKGSSKAFNVLKAVNLSIAAEMSDYTNSLEVSHARSNYSSPIPTVDVISDFAKSSEQYS